VVDDCAEQLEVLDLKKHREQWRRKLECFEVIFPFFIDCTLEYRSHGGLNGQNCCLKLSLHEGSEPEGIDQEVDALQGLVEDGVFKWIEHAHSKYLQADPDSHLIKSLLVVTQWAPRSCQSIETAFDAA